MTGWIILFAFVGALVVFLAYAVRGRSSQAFGPSVYKGSRNRPLIALTFDDGPSESTPELLAILKKHNVLATFFMCGRNVDRLPEVARMVQQAGHEIGNHTDSHPRFDFCSAKFIENELSVAQKKIQAATGVTPKYFRAPYGMLWFGLRHAQRQLNLLGVMWTKIPHDWRWPAERISQFVENARPGDIICMHDGRTTESAPDISATLQAVDTVIPVLKQRGLRFGTVSEVIARA